MNQVVPQIYIEITVSIDQGGIEF